MRHPRGSGRRLRPPVQRRDRLRQATDALPSRRNDRPAVPGLLQQYVPGRRRRHRSRLPGARLGRPQKSTTAPTSPASEASRSASSNARSPSLPARAVRPGSTDWATNLLGHHRYPASDLVSLYHKRWEVESTYFAIKKSMLGRRVLRSKTWTGIAQEVYSLLRTRPCGSRSPTPPRPHPERTRTGAVSASRSDAPAIRSSRLRASSPTP
ncbi:MULTISPECIES: transposase [unclassified Streptomyces]|uniref:transposase n=1 Tax=unclassified Streptomyces TaxID=2593676 RepID=UPI002E0E724C